MSPPLPQIVFGVPAPLQPLQSCAVPARGSTATLAAGVFSPILRLTSWPLINAYNRINLLRRARTGQSVRETVHGQDEK